jgi:hypothetical protein
MAKREGRPLRPRWPSPTGREPTWPKGEVGVPTWPNPHPMAKREMASPYGRGGPLWPSQTYGGLHGQREGDRGALRLPLAIPYGRGRPLWPKEGRQGGALRPLWPSPTYGRRVPTWPSPADGAALMAKKNDGHPDGQSGFDHPDGHPLRERPPPYGPEREALAL